VGNNIPLFLMDFLGKFFSQEEITDIVGNFPHEWCQQLENLLSYREKHEITLKQHNYDRLMTYIESDEYVNYLNQIDHLIDILLLSVTNHNKDLFTEKIRDTIEGFCLSVNYNPLYNSSPQTIYDEWSSSRPEISVEDNSKLELNVDEIKVISFTLLINQPLKITRQNNDKKYKRRKILDEYKENNLLSSSGNIEYLILNKCNINKEGLKYICLGLKLNKKIQLIALINNDIDHFDINYICELIETNRSLVKIDLEKNNIGNEGARKMGSASVKNETLRTILLAYNGIDDEGAKNLSDLLKESAITKLSLDYKSYPFQNNNRNNDYEDRIFVNKYKRKISVDNYGYNGGLYAKFSGEV